MKRWQFVLWMAALVLLPLALVAFFWIENWRGARAWAEVDRELAARHEPLELSALLPPQVPAEQDLSKAPVIVRAANEGYISSGSTAPVGWADMPTGRGDRRLEISKKSWATAHPLPLAEWQKHFATSGQCPHPAQPGAPAADVLLALSVFGPLLDELVRETETRTEARVPVDWQPVPAANLFFPAGLKFTLMASTLRLRACAELAEGQNDRALRDTLAALRLREALGRVPTFVGLLEARSAAMLALQPVWEGLAARRWTADEMRQIEEALRRDDELADYVQAVRGDRVLDTNALESMRRSSASGEAFISGGSSKPIGPAQEWMAHFMTVAPRGWIDQNKASAARLYQGYIDAVDLRAHRVFFAKQASADAAVSDLRKKPFLVYTLFARMVLPAETHLLPLAVRGQTACEQAEVACALERYYLERQAYPDALDALVPSYLDRVPNDLVDGEPMRYRRTADGRYLLYGVGWNGRDDGGTVAWRSDPPDRPNDEEGDWVWQYTPLNPPTAKP